MSQPVAPCADFSGVVERVPTKQASGGIWAVLRRNLPWGKQPQIGWHSPTIWLQDKGTGLQSTLARFTAARNADCTGVFRPLRHQNGSGL